MSCARLSGVDHFTVGLEKPYLLAIRQPLDADPIALLAGRVPQRHLAQRQRHLLLDDAAGLVGLRVALGVALDAVDVLDQHLSALQHTDHGAAPALVTARQNYHLIAFPDLFHIAISQRTSGASEIIFMNCALRSSRVTGPKMRVPIGSSLLVSSTAALPSNLISEPSARRTPNRVRTTPASYTSPFLTLPRGIASLTLTLMTSPTVA